MATLIGHSVAGITCVLLGRRLGHERLLVPWLVFGLVAGNAADLDFVPGILVGDINRFHHGATHSLTAVLLFGVASLMLSRALQARPIELWISGTLAYGSHLLLDYFCEDARAPYGIPLFWPLSEQHFVAAQPILSGVKHGVPGDSLLVFLSQVFSWENLAVVVLEVAVVFPLLAAMLVLKRFKIKKQPRY